MLADVLAAFLDAVTETEFYPVFQELLRSRGFSEVHLLHGAYEFGKDSIGQRESDGVRTQHAFQLKAGDIDLNTWRTTKMQIDQIRTNGFGHPGFDRDLPRRGVLVLTGQLKGAAAGDAQEYAEHVAETSAFRFEVWDRTRVITELLEAPHIGLAGAADGPLLELVGRIDGGTVNDRDIERFTRRWMRPLEALSRAALECVVVGARCRSAGRLDLASIAALGLIRAAWSSAHGVDPQPPRAAQAAATGRQIFAAFAGELYAAMEEGHLSPRGLVAAHPREVGFTVTYQVRALRVAELLALYGLLLRAEEQEGVAPVLSRVVEFVRQQPGVRHPISDRWAVSLVPVVLATALIDRALAETVLRDTLKWVIDHYDKAGQWGLGLADWSANPQDELEYLLGGPLEFIDRDRRSASYLVTVLIDLAGVLQFEQLYSDAVNDAQAVDIHAVCYSVLDSVGQYEIGGEGEGLVLHPHVAYPDALPTDGRPIAAHHRPASEYLPLRTGRPWDLIAVSALMRDRHWPAAVAMLV